MAVVALAAGAWSAPEAAVTQAVPPEPGGLAPGVSLTGGARTTGGDAWLAVGGGGWAWPTRPDLGEVWLAPAAGWEIGAKRAGDRGGAVARAAGSVRLGFFPGEPAAGNVRSAGEVNAGWRAGGWEVALRAQGVERTWPGEAAWNVGGASVGPAARWQGEDVRVAAWVDGQANHAVALDPFGVASVARGGQVQAGGGVGVTLGRVGLDGRYAVAVAWGGAPDLAARPAFTLLGEADPDVDLASGGGFVAHRAELAATLDAGGGWCLGVDARGRIREELDGVVLGHARRALRGKVTAEVVGGARASAGALGWLALSWGEGGGCR